MTNTLLAQIRLLAKDFFSETIACRRHLHSNPELSFAEYNTSEFIAGKLKEYKIAFTGGIAGTGISGIIEGKNPLKKTIALRADMDALPIQEAGTAVYKSKIPGVMHACGHDVHSASLLGAARILQRLRGHFEGSVKLIFQPGEEKLPGGASLMIKEGVLENPRPSAILAQHVMPQLEAGKIGIRKGLYMASTDELYLSVKGKGGHAALPDTYVNPLLIASAILLKLQEDFMNPGTKKIPDIPTVLAFGKIEGRGATNVIPQEVTLEGTFRTMDEKWRSEAHGMMKAAAEKIAAQMHGSCDFTIIRGYPFLINDENLTERVREYASEYLGAENVVEIDRWMTAEDFAYYTHHTAACFYRLGTRNESRGIVSPVHTPSFDIDENALETGTGLMAWLAICELNL